MEKLPYKDFTIKAKNADHVVAEKILMDAGARCLGLDQQKDTYFSTSLGKLKLRQGTLENLITHYERVQDSGIEKTIVYRYDLNPSQHEIDELISNHKIIGVVEKARKIFYLGTTKIHLDTLLHNQRFIEIEAIDRGDQVELGTLRVQCLQIKKLLGIRDEDLLKTGYL